MAKHKVKKLPYRRRGGCREQWAVARALPSLTVEQTIRAICEAVDACSAPEIVLLEELDALAEGWRMRITELVEKDGEA